MSDGCIEPSRLDGAVCAAPAWSAGRLGRSGLYTTATKPGYVCWWNRVNSRPKKPLDTCNPLLDYNVFFCDNTIKRRMNLGYDRCSLFKCFSWTLWNWGQAVTYFLSPKFKYYIFQIQNLFPEFNILAISWRKQKGSPIWLLRKKLAGFDTCFILEAVVLKKSGRAF